MGEPVTQSAHTPREQSPQQRWRRRALFALTAGASLYFVWSLWDGSALTTWMRQQNPLAFFCAMAVLPILGAPLTPLYVLAGATFGVPLGLLGSALALALYIVLCYLIARGRLRGLVHRLLQRVEFQLPDFARDKGVLRFILLVKLTPGLPGCVRNYLLVMAGVPFALYFTASLTLATLYALPLVVLGKSLLDPATARSLLVILVGLSSVIALGRWWRKRARHKAARSI